MSALERILRRSAGLPGEQRALTRESVPTTMLPDAGPVGLGPREALAVAEVYACVRALADAAASVPLVAYRRTDAGRRRQSGGHLAELLRRPGPATSQANLIAQAVAHLNLFGNAYLGKYRDQEGRVAQLALLRPERVSVELRAGEPVYRVLFDDGHLREHGAQDVVHVRALSTDGLVGLSPIAQAREAIGLSRMLTRHADALFRNSARPSGIVKVGSAGQGAPVASKEFVDQFTEAWRQGFGGPENRYGVAVVSGEVDFVSVAMPLTDAEFVAQRKLSATEVARIFRVPPWIIGAEGGGSMTYSNVEQESLHFVTYALRPWLVLIEQAFSNDADLCPGGLYVEFLLDALLRADTATRAEVYTKALDPVTGWMSRNEVRRLENLEPEETSA